MDIEGNRKGGIRLGLGAPEQAMGLHLVLTGPEALHIFDLIGREAYRMWNGSQPSPNRPPKPPKRRPEDREFA